MIPPPTSKVVIPTAPRPSASPSSPSHTSSYYSRDGGEIVVYQFRLETFGRRIFYVIITASAIAIGYVLNELFTSYQLTRMRDEWRAKTREEKASRGVVVGDQQPQQPAQQLQPQSTSTSQFPNPDPSQFHPAVLVSALSTSLFEHGVYLATVLGYFGTFSVAAFIYFRRGVAEIVHLPNRRIRILTIGRNSRLFGIRPKEYSADAIIPVFARAGAVSKGVCVCVFV